MLKDSWKDKINGESIVDAEDINEIAHSIINLEKSGGASIKLAQDVNGDSTEKAVSQKAVKDALAGKVDKITEDWRAYTTDANGNTVAKPLAAKPSEGGVVLYNEGGILKTNAPVEDDDAANKKFVEDGFVPRSKLGWALYGTDSKPDENGYMGNRMVYGSCLGTQANTVATYHLATNNDKFRDDAITTCTIAVADPIKPIQAANKRFVESITTPLANDVAVIWDALGGVIEYASIDSKDNPVTVLANALPAATLDKIGTGIKTDVDSIVSSVIQGNIPSGVTASYNDGLFTINSDEYVTDVIDFTTRFSKTLSVGSTYYFFAEVVSGSYDISGEGDLFVADGMNVIKVGELFHGTADFEGDEMSTPINVMQAAVKYNNLVLRISIGEAVSVRGVPVASVKKGDETVYTVPEAIRTLTHDPTNDLGKMPVYGLAKSDTVYNYLDLEKKQYVIKCAQNVYGEIMVEDVTIDVSAYIADEDGEITVAAGDEILFADADGNSVGSTVPSTITYIVKKGASQ